MKLATRRIEELSGKEKAMATEIAALEVTEPGGPRRDEIEAILSSLPDLSEVFDEAEPDGLMELFDASAWQLLTTNRAGSSTSASCSAATRRAA